MCIRDSRRYNERHLRESQRIFRKNNLTNKNMNREIKFRGFDDGVIVYSHNNSINNDNQQLSWFFNKIREDAILMQYTGLKDKNGVEVFEGDIVERRYLHGSVNRGYIEFVNGSFKIRYIKLEVGVAKVVGFSTISKGYKIIGNIYENPELLK
jgi:uncharacterized phage protein (TIGR01671 family)